MEVRELSSAGKRAILPLSRREAIEKELKFVEWHKMANSAAIKGALLQRRDNSPPKAPQHMQDDERWIKRIIKEEHIRPLNVTKDFVLTHQEEEKVHTERLAYQLDKHLSTLKILRQKLEAQQDLKTRSEAHSAWKPEFMLKKHAVLMGKTLQEYEAMQPPRTANLSDPQDAEIDNDAMQKRKASHNRNVSAEELSTVLDSLSRLADLEQRIAGLEKENKFDKMVEKENPGGTAQRSSIEFRKKRNPTDSSGPVGISYQIRPKANAGGPWSMNMPVGGGSNAARAQQQQGQMMYDQHDAGGETFITATNTDGSIAQIRERARQLELASAGQQNLRGRLQDKRVRTKEQMLGAKKHEAAMKEMARRKNENSRKPAKMGISGAARNADKKVVLPGKGIAAGLKNKNKQLQEFENMKVQYRKRKEANERKSYAADSTGVGKRFGSQTAPAYAYDNKNHPQYRVPNIKVGGTVTRRTDGVPARRPTRTISDTLSSRQPSTAPAIAVSGLAGLRVLKAHSRFKPAD